MCRKQGLHLIHRSDHVLIEMPPMHGHVAHRQSATSTTAVVTKATEAVSTKATEPVFTRATEPVITKAAEPVVTKVEGETGETPTEEDKADYEGREPVEELVPAPKEYEDIWLVEEEKEDLPVAMGKDEKTEENEAVVDGVKRSFGMIGEEEEAGQDEGIDKDIEQVSHFVGR